MIKSLVTLLAVFGFSLGDAEKPYASLGDAEKPYASLGDAEKPYASLGDAEKPYASLGDAEKPYTIRAIDSNELKGFSVLEAHDADEWFV